MALVAAAAAAAARVSDHHYLGPRVPPKMTVSARDGKAVAKEDKAFWLESGQEELDLQLNKPKILQKAKNVIYFLADGTGISTLTAARILKGQRTGNYEREIMSYETFPYSSIIKTYNTNMQTTDSAASATAYLCGVKANQETIGVDANVQVKDCDAMNNEEYFATSILRNFQDAGRATGVVTTTRVTHASPAGTYAHTAMRDWESDADVAEAEEDPQKCMDIAKQLVKGTTGSKINVVMGGGREKFLPSNMTDPEFADKTGAREDGEDLTQTWLEGREGGAFVATKEALMALDTAEVDHILGLFDMSHMQYALDEDASNPSLEEMTRKAIEVLRKNENGFFLFVEGGLIDWAHHENQPHHALEEALEFEKAIAAADELTDEEDTLIIVTADHSQPIVINGYTPRNADILGIAGDSNIDNQTYTTLLYTNGPGYSRTETEGRQPPTEEDVANKEYRHESAVPMEYSNHNGEDIMLYAKGPLAHLFTGVHENSYIPAALRYAACVGEEGHRSYCADAEKGSAATSSASAVLLLLCAAASRFL